jgi:serine/threonine protein kinase
MIHFPCPECGAKLKGRYSRSGRKQTCPACGNKVLVPAESVHTPRAMSAAADDSPSQPPSPGPAEVTRNGATGSSVAMSAGTEGSSEDASFLDRPQAPDEIGRLGPFRVLEVLGSGATGIVFRAEDTQLRRSVALKVLRPSIAANAESRRRFLREARAVAAFDHDNILTVHQVGEDHGIPWLAMKMLRGRSLKDRLHGATNTIPVDEALRIGAEVADALAAAHAGGLVHRDVKPSNILLEETSERVKLIDFGLALVHDDEGQLTRSGCVVGTPAYMAPEQADGGAVDHRSDLYALGCVLYRSCTGRLPFEGSTFMQVFFAQRTKDAIRPRELEPEIPKELDEFIMRLLAKDAAKRPQSAAEVRDALCSLRAELAARNAPWLAYAAGDAGIELPAGSSESLTLAERWAEAVAEASAPPDTLIRSSSRWTRHKNLPKWLMGAAAASVAILALIIFIATRR